METEYLISKYFSEGLSKGETKQLQTLLEKDPQLMKDFNFEKNLRAGLLAEERKTLKIQLQGFEEDLELPERQSRPLNRRWLAIAASVVLFASLGLLLWHQNQPSRLYDQYFQGYEQTEMVITRDATQTLKRDAFDAYDLENYAEAISYLEQIKNEGQTDYAGFYLGLSHLELGDMDKALPYFETIIESDSKYASEALWYAALAHLKDKNTEQALSYLQQLLGKGDFKQPEAKALLEALQ